jgi:hypothetical protein
MENAMRKGCRKLPIHCLQGQRHIPPGAFLFGTSINEKGSPNFRADGKKRGNHKDLSYAFLNFSVYR